MAGEAAWIVVQGYIALGSVHLEHAKTEYSSLFHYAITPFSAAESNHRPTWHRRELALGMYPNNSVWEYRLMSRSLRAARRAKPKKYGMYLILFTTYSVSFMFPSYKNVKRRNEQEH